MSQLGITPCKRASSPISAAVVGDNDDLVMEILLFLPAIYVIRFKLVSKRWNSLISAPHFGRLHTVRHRDRPKPQRSFILRSNASHLFTCHPTVRKLIPYPFTSRYEGTKIIHSCNGLLLLVHRYSPIITHKEHYVFNPVTKKYRRLVIDKMETLSGLCLMFDPYKSPFYKVFCFRREDSAWFEVYDSETHTWRRGVETTNLRPKNFGTGIYWNNDMYFITPRTTLICFVPDDDFYFLREKPRIQSPGAKKNYVMESNGHMHYIVQSLLQDDNYLCIFEMSKDDSSWFIQYNVDLNPVSAAFGEMGGMAISLLGIIRGDNEEDSVLLFHVPGMIMLYRFHDEKFEVLVDFRTENFYKEGELQFGSKDVYQFIETLAPV